MEILYFLNISIQFCNLTDHVNVINSQLCEWLKRAELHQAPNPYSRGFFKKEGEQLSAITEVDATPVKDFFTVLCVGEDIFEHCHFPVSHSDNSQLDSCQYCCFIVM